MIQSSFKWRKSIIFSHRDMLLGISLFFTLFFCGVLGKTEEIYDSREFKDYWYGGKAEITSYELHQARYGEIHNGNAVLIFVTEDFSLNKHVKLDNTILKQRTDLGYKIHQGLSL